MSIGPHASKHAPYLRNFRGRTRHLEFLAETYHHDLTSLRSPDAFMQELADHGVMTEEQFGQQPVVVADLSNRG